VLLYKVVSTYCTTDDNSQFDLLEAIAVGRYNAAIG
jgi:hypothetical protein